MGKKAQGKSAKLIRKGQLAASEEEYSKCPHSFVFQRGQIGKTLGHLVQDMRRVMSPYTAENLKVRKNNVLKDFVSVAGPLHVTHFIIFTKTDTGCYMRVARLPRGPTLTFKIASYSLSSDVISSLKRHNMEMKQFLHHPLLVMNNFSGDGVQLKLMTTMFQNLFQSINVNKVKLSGIRRCVLLNYNSETKLTEFRHYNIRAVPVGLSRSVKKIARHTVPDLGKFKDISEYVLRDGNASESEAEMDGPHNEVLLPQDLSGLNVKSSRSAIRLTEIGPRMTLQLVKVEEGLCEGDVLFHEFVTKTPEEIRAQKLARERKRKVKSERRRQQEENVARKKAQLEAERRESRRAAGLGDTEDDGADKMAADDEDDYDDAGDDRLSDSDDDGEESAPPPQKKQRRSSQPATNKKAAKPAKLHKTSTRGDKLSKRSYSDGQNGKSFKKKSSALRKNLTPQRVPKAAKSKARKMPGKRNR